jgi:hypothetical protein
VQFEKLNEFMILPSAPAGYDRDTTAAKLCTKFVRPNRRPKPT